MTAIHWQEPRRQVRYPKGRRYVHGAVELASATVRKWQRRARERGQLAQLDDRMLKDIGLTRADAEFLANKPFWRE